MGKNKRDSIVLNGKLTHLHWSGHHQWLVHLSQILAVFSLVFLSESSALAHKVNVFAFVEGDKLVVDGYLSGGSKAQNAVVQVHDSNGVKLAESKTNTKGVCEFSLGSIKTDSQSLKVVLEADMGHRGEYVVELHEPLLNIKNTQVSQRVESGQAALTSVDSKSSEPPGRMNMDDLARSLGPIIDQKLEPLVKMLAQQERILIQQQTGGPRLNEIAGGIGWIIGLAGIAAFFWRGSRK